MTSNGGGRVFGSPRAVAQANVRAREPWASGPSSGGDVRSACRSRLPSWALGREATPAAVAQQRGGDALEPPGAPQSADRRRPPPPPAGAPWSDVTPLSRP